jgi:hypothetical protein
MPISGADFNGMVNGVSWADGLLAGNSMSLSDPEEPFGISII